LQQGMLEDSNVNVVDEFIQMIVTQRAYESNSKVVQAADQMLQDVNNMSH
jgi:flagellar basal-body rod protein FlgG